MCRLLVSLFILSLLIGCRSKESSILSDEDVSEKCRSIVGNFESWFDGDTIKWLEETRWELVSTRHKDMVIEVMAKFQYPYGSEFTQVFALGYMDPAYAFPRIARFKSSLYSLARGEVAEAIPLKGRYKKSALRILVELLFDPDKDVRTGVACTISRRLEDTDSLPLLLLHYFENIYQKPVTLRDAISEQTTDWVKALAESEYRDVLVPWFELLEQKRRQKKLGDGGLGCWDDMHTGRDEVLLEGKRIAEKMKRKYL